MQQMIVLGVVLARLLFQKAEREREIHNFLPITWRKFLRPGEETYNNTLWLMLQHSFEWKRSNYSSP